MFFFSLSVASCSLSSLPSTRCFRFFVSSAFCPYATLYHCKSTSCFLRLRGGFGFYALVFQMFIIQSKQPSYCGHSFASSSCQTEYNGKVESALEAKTSLGGLSKGLRRNSSNLSQLYVQDHCVADATQIEIDVSSITNSPFFIRIVTPCGESGVLDFAQYGTAQVFKPQQHGCGHGIWKFDIYQLIDNSETLLISESMQLYGVGTLFFTVDDDLHPRLSGQEFLYMSGLCAKLRT